MTDWLYAKVKRVPGISDAEIAEMRHIEPVLQSEGNWFRRMAGAESLDPRHVSFLWNAEPTGERFTFHQLNMTTIVTQHYSSVFFKPSLAEVYAWMRFFCGADWQLFSHFCLGDARRISGSTDCVCECVLMGGKRLVPGKEVTFATGVIGHELVEASE